MCDDCGLDLWMCLNCGNETYNKADTDKPCECCDMRDWEYMPEDE